MPSFPTAEEFLPARFNLKSLRDAVQHCRGCDLYKNATQAVFGEGPRKARSILLGEIPGDEEDKQGRPFVGPAGRLLDNALDEAGLARDEVYVTNAVKHFRWEPRGKRRLHKKPQRGKSKPVSRGCTPRFWSSSRRASSAWAPPRHRPCSAAISASQNTAVSFSTSDDVAWLMATYHPSAILRAPEKADRDQMRSEFVHDLHRAAQRLNSSVGKRRPAAAHSP